MTERSKELEKFDFDREYGREEFLYYCELLKAPMTKSDVVRQTLEEWVTWAERFPVGTVIKWDQKEDATIYPYRSLGEVRVSEDASLD